jgi:hypothetical protein
MGVYIALLILLVVVVFGGISETGIVKEEKVIYWSLASIITLLRLLEQRNLPFKLFSFPSSKVAADFVSKRKVLISRDEVEFSGDGGGVNVTLRSGL